MKLCPAQQQVLDQLMPNMSLFPVIGLCGNPGAGKTTILREMHRRTGGEWIAAREILHAMRVKNPLAIEETFEQLVETAFQTHDHVYIDDLSQLTNVVSGCGAYPRLNFIASAFESLSARAEADRKKLIYSSYYQQPELAKKGFVGTIPPFQIPDYEFFCRAYIGPALADQLDYRKVYRFARSLHGYDLKAIGMLLRGEKTLDTERYIETLRSFGLTSNVNLDEVQQVTLDDLKGVNDILESLEANVIIPLEQVDLADDLRLKPKRGVLLVGPPGTGKTTVGRALAHRLKSKFFLIDGTCIAGANDFYYRIQQVFAEAKHNAPSIIFVDDSDAIFESGEELGLYRYLLTMLDGLESESAGQVCVMMTAMDVGHLPPALIRSGRVELWLEMRLPDDGARSEILEQMLAKQASAFAGVDVAKVVAATAGFTGADLKRMLEDGKNLFAYDKVHARPLLSVTEYFLQAVQTVRDNKAHYAEAEARARQLRPSRPVHFDQPPTTG